MVVSPVHDTEKIETGTKLVEIVVRTYLTVSIGKITISHHI